MSFSLQIYEPCQQCGLPENPYHTANGCDAACGKVVREWDDIAALPVMRQFIKDSLAEKGMFTEFECATCKKPFETDHNFSAGDDDIPKECLTCFEDIAEIAGTITCEKCKSIVPD